LALLIASAAGFSFYFDFLTAIFPAIILVFLVVRMFVNSQSGGMKNV